MASSVGNQNILRSAIAVIGACAVFFSGLAVGSYVYGSLLNPVACPSNRQAATSLPSTQQPAGQPVAAGGGMLQGTVSAISANSLTIDYFDSDPARAKEKTTKTLSMTSETVITERIRLSLTELDALMKKASNESQKNGVPFVPPQNYEERPGKLSDIKQGTEVVVAVAPADVAGNQPKALQVYYYSTR